MKKIILTITTILSVAILASGCAHTGLVAGESINSPNIDRNNYAANAGVESPTIPDTKSQAEVYAHSRKISEALETAINDVLKKAAKAIIKSEKAASEFSANVPDTSIPDLSLPTITVKNQTDELETIGNTELEIPTEITEEETKNK